MIEAVSFPNKPLPSSQVCVVYNKSVIQSGQVYVGWAVGSLAMQCVLRLVYNMCTACVQTREPP